MSTSSKLSLKHTLLLGSSVAAFALGVAPAMAQNANGGAQETIIVTGTRVAGLRAVDSPAPIQVLGAPALARVGSPGLIQALALSAPSFNAQAIGNDMANETLSARLRGLSPNHVLVLVNGKRRHGTANLSILSSAFQGGAAADLNMIPVAAIDHIEVLQDGAAAQYGSDAIAGVVNVILKSADHGGAISATGGQFMEGDGTTTAVSVNKGFSLADRGHVNVTVEQRYHDFTRQGGGDRRLSNPDGSLLASVAGTLNAGVLSMWTSSMM